MSFVDLNYTDIYTGSPSLPQNIQGSVMSNLLWDRIHFRLSPESESGRFVPSTVHLVQTIGMIILQTHELGHRLCPPRGTQPKMCCSPDSPERRQFILQGKASRFTNQLTGILQYRHHLSNFRETRMPLFRISYFLHKFPTHCILLPNSLHYPSPTFTGL